MILLSPYLLSRTARRATFLIVIAVALVVATCCTATAAAPVSTVL
jgi:hypothetical protein